MAKGKPTLKTLYFIAGAQATADELAEAETFQPGVQFRMAGRVVPGDPVEPFDRVAGAVPADYAASDGKPARSMTKAEKRLVEREEARDPDPAPKPAEKPAAKPKGAATAWRTSVPSAAPTPPAKPAVAWKPNA